MAILYIDTVTPVLKVSLELESQVFSKEGPIKSGSILLFHYVEDLFQQSGRSIDQVEAIFFNRGPGSFTGIKVGTVFAQGLAFSSEVSLRSFTTFDLMDLEAGVPFGAFYTIYAFQNEFFMAQRISDRWEFEVISREKAKGLENVYYLGPKQHCLDNFLTLEGLSADSLPRLRKNGRLEDEIEPLYLKKSTAEMNLKKTEASQVEFFKKS